VDLPLRIARFDSVRSQENGHRLADDFGGGIPHQALRPGIPLGHPAFGIEREERVLARPFEQQAHALFALTDRGGLGGLGAHRPVEQHGDERDGSDERRGQADRVAERIGRDQPASRWCAARQRDEVRGHHARVVHAADRRAHQDRARRLQPRRAPHPVVTELDEQPQRRQRGADGDDDRQRHERSIVLDRGRHPHRGHTDVVHARDGGAHEQAGHDERRHARRRPADDHEREKRRGHRHQRREDDEVDGVADRQVEAEREHRDEVHAPDADAHREGAAEEPGDPDAARRDDPPGQLKRGVRSDAGDDDGEDDEGGIVRRMQHR
jgi:hypothetical protein